MHRNEYETNAPFSTTLEVEAYNNGKKNSFFQKSEGMPSTYHLP